MPQLEFFVVSESASVDKSRNTVSAFHIFNKIGLDTLPGSIPLMSALAAWVFSEAELAAKSEIQVRLEFRPPGDENPRLFRINLTASVRFQNMHLQLENIPVKATGDFLIALFDDDVRQATHTIEIVEVAGATG